MHFEEVTQRKGDAKYTTVGGIGQTAAKVKK